MNEAIGKTFVFVLFDFCGFSCNHTRIGKYNAFRLTVSVWKIAFSVGVTLEDII